MMEILNFFFQATIFFSKLPLYREISILSDFNENLDHVVIWCGEHDGVIDGIFQATIIFCPPLSANDGILLCFGSQVTDLGSWEPLVFYIYGHEKKLSLPFSIHTAMKWNFLCHFPYIRPRKETFPGIFYIYDHDREISWLYSKYMAMIKNLPCCFLYIRPWKETCLFISYIYLAMIRNCPCRFLRPW